MSWERLGVIAIAALATLLVTTGNGHADPILMNGNFESLPGTLSGGKNFYTTDIPTGWGGGAGGLSAINSTTGAVNTATLSTNGTIGVYGPFPNSPTGGNFLQADGDPNFRPGAFTTQVTGLVAGQKYGISFYQAAGQQSGFTGATFEHWDVTLGSETHSSNQMLTPSMGVTPWQLDTLFFTATGSSETLSFLAVGGLQSGGLANAPPIVFLDGVSIATPEPSSIVVMCLVLVALGIAYRRHRASLPAAI